MENPFSEHYNPGTDRELADAALNGSKGALEALIKRHQHYIYNVAAKLVLSPFDAEDITQEVLIKVITKLAQFRGESDFRTWLYRITFNHFLQMKKYWLEETITTFDQYGGQLDNIADEELTAQEKAERREFIEDAKLSCMNGMLLCLNRQQRLVYVLGELFGMDHTLGAQLIGISRDNFRQQLSRARKDLYQFMQNRCGLLNTANPCRCAKKTNGFIKAGWVDKRSLKFNTAYLSSINQVAPEKSTSLDTALEIDYAELFRNQPFQQKEHAEKLLSAFLTNSKVNDIFGLG
ncbi:RNA polymerase sigma factor [Spirosoma arcticum]